MAYVLDEETGTYVDEAELMQRRRERAAQEPVTQKITYNPDGTQKVTITGTPESLSAANPNTPTVSGPVAPDELYRRMIQAESRGRDFDAQGRPLTSPAGAMFAAQVMPSTARQPGFGIRPAAAQTPEEYNRVGREYFAAMQRQFPGNDMAAVAAYNAGPGRVQRNMAANQGQLNVSQLPQETQQYMQRVGLNQTPSQAQAALGGGAAQPSAQAQAASPAEPASLYSLATGQTGVGLQAPAGAQPQPGAAPDTTSKLIDFYQRNQDNPQALFTMGYSEAPGMPDFMRERMKNRAAELIQQQREEAAAKQKLSTMNESDIARALREKTTGGSYLKLALYSLLGMEQSGYAEAAKLGIGKETAGQLEDGTPVMMKVAANGTPIEGFNARTGMKLTPEELVSAQAGVVAQKGVEVGAQVFKDPENIVKGSFVLERRPGRNVYREIGTNRPATAEESARLNAVGVAGTLDTQRMAQIQRANIDLATAWEKAKIALAKEGPEAANKILGETNARFGQNFTYNNLQGAAPQLDLTTGQMIVGSQPAPQGAAPSQAQRAAPQTTTPQTTPQTTTPQTAPSQAQRAMQGGVQGGMTPAALETQEKINRERTESFNKILDTEIRPEGQKGDAVSAARRQQFDIFNRPGVDMNKIFGIATGAGRSAGDQSWTLVRDVILGKYEGRVDDIKQRAAALGLTPAEASALAEYQIANVEVNAANLKRTAGPGAVSDAEQKINREAGVDPTKVPALAAYNAMAQSKFDADKSRYKADWATTSKATNALELDKEWRQESSRLTKIYSDIARIRIKFINDNGSTTAAVQEAYKRYPIPEYVPGEGWKKTRPLDSFNR